MGRLVARLLALDFDLLGYFLWVCDVNLRVWRLPPNEQLLGKGDVVGVIEGDDASDADSAANCTAVPGFKMYANK